MVCRCAQFVSQAKRMFADRLHVPFVSLDTVKQVYLKYQWQLSHSIFKSK